jgi:hypothetical protein
MESDRGRARGGSSLLIALVGGTGAEAADASGAGAPTSRPGDGVPDPAHGRGGDGPGALHPAVPPRGGGGGRARRVLDIDTPGGRVDAAEQIADAIGDAGIPVYAYVNRRALSAGALIALAADGSTCVRARPSAPRRR